MDIQMKSGYIVLNKPVHRTTKAIIVSNYDGGNNVINWTYSSVHEARLDRYLSTDIGLWKIKRKKK